ncbi:MAG: hypothetical protein ACREVG_14135 [Burkholderiales bacterium]
MRGEGVSESQTIATTISQPIETQTGRDGSRAWLSELIGGTKVSLSCPIHRGSEVMQNSLMHAHRHQICPTDHQVGGRESNFARWFGRSRIVGADGAPKIVYHGTTADFDTFRSKRRMPALGFHFGSVSQADFFVGCHDESLAWLGGRILPCYLRIENPLRMPDVFDRGFGGADEVAYWLLRERLIDQRTRERICNAKSAREAYDRVLIAMEAIGFDGITYENVHEGGTWDTNEDAYIAFRSEQIKSVFNHGTFDLARPSILD